MSAPAKGDIISYRAFAGDVWPAQVTWVIAGETFTFVDLDVILPNQERLSLRAVRWWDESELTDRGAGWPKSKT